MKTRGFLSRGFAISGCTFFLCFSPEPSKFQLGRVLLQQSIGRFPTEPYPWGRYSSRFLLSSAIITATNCHESALIRKSAPSGNTNVLARTSHNKNDTCSKPCPYSGLIKVGKSMDNPQPSRLSRAPPKPRKTCCQSQSCPQHNFDKTIQKSI